jgi:hypothetical protein
MAAKTQGKKILVRGSSLVPADKVFNFKSTVDPSEYKHAKENTTFLATKYGTYSFQGYEAFGANQKV